MIITNSFIYIHFPKTGGTFTSDVLEKLHLMQKERRDNSLIRRLFYKKPYFEDYQENSYFQAVGNGFLNHGLNHNGVSLIPDRFSRLPIFTVLRNPYDFYTSFYEADKWHKIELDGNQTKLFPNFPKLSFSQFIDFLNVYHTNYLLKRITQKEITREIGLYTLIFLFLYSDHPLNEINKFMEKGEQYSFDYERNNKIKNLVFLDYNQLNLELVNTLSTFYDKKDLEFIEFEERKNVSVRRRTEDWMSYYTAEIIDKISKRDRIGIEIYNKIIDV